MIGRLIDRWADTWPDIWEPLGDHQDAPPDLYNELYRAAVENFRRKPTYDALSQISSDPQHALDAFRAVKTRDFKDEAAMVELFEDVHDVLQEFDVDGLVRSYVELVESFLAKFNLRYRLVHPFALRVQLPWLYADIYTELCRLNERDPHLNELMEDFEDAFDGFIRNKKRRDLTTSIAKASNYAEGIAATMSGTNSGSLGKMLDSLNVWPHKAVQDSIDKLYGFCSDYPGIRHAGNRNGRLRKLNAKDTLLVSALLMAFSGYMHQDVDVGSLLK